MDNETGVQDKWEFSLLIDRASSILEARGFCQRYLGTPDRQLIGRPLLHYLDEIERLPFLRYMARLIVRGDADAVSATLRVPVTGVRRFTIAPKKSDSAKNWWIMFSPVSKASSNALTDDTQRFATADEFATIVAANDAKDAPLDITVFRAHALGENGATQLSPAERQALDDKLGEALLDHAHQGIVARPEAGEYALLHSRGQNSAAIEETIAKVAKDHNIAPEDLGLVHETRELPSANAVNDLIREMRQRVRIAEPILDPIAVAPRRNRLALMIAGGVAAALVVVAACYFAL
ncbi:MAG TPA: hypothetical protein VGM59_11525 [Dongiaceae bacterium]